MIPVMVLCGKRTFDMTVPCTNDFLDPQNKTVIRSSSEKPKKRLSIPIQTNTTKNKTIIPKASPASSRAVKSSKRCSENDLQNEM